MALKTKTPRLISINGETDTGGAPIFADDIVRVQENDQADIINYFEAMRRLLPELLTWDGATLSKQFQNGLILSGLEYDNTNPAAPVVSEGYILSGGEICYYPGGAIATGGVNRGLLYLFKGAAVNTARVFNVGGSKDILVKYDVVVETANTSINGVELPAATTLVGTDEVVVLGIGVAGPFVGEDYFTTRTAKGITSIGDQASKTAFASATLSGLTTLGTALPYLASRVNVDGTTEVHGSILVPTSMQVGTSVEVASLVSHNINSTGSIPLTATSANGVEVIIAGSSGAVRIIEPVGGWLALNPINITISAKVIGTTTLPTPYNYNNAFLDIT